MFGSTLIIATSAVAGPMLAQAGIIGPDTGVKLSTVLPLATGVWWLANMARDVRAIKKQMACLPCKQNAQPGDLPDCETL